MIAATTILSARSGLALTALPAIVHTARGSTLTMTELNAARNCSADAVWMVAPDAATARAKLANRLSMLYRNLLFDQRIAWQAAKISNQRRTQLRLDIDVDGVVKPLKPSDRK